MKKLMIVFILVSVVVGLYSEDNLLWCKKVLFNEPTKHIIQKGDYFSKLSKHYYGTTKYWRELALINRAPNKDLVFPGEEVIIPSLEAIQKLHKSRSLTRVNSIVDDQIEWIAKNHNVSTTPLAERIENSGGENVGSNVTTPQIPEPVVSQENNPQPEVANQSMQTPAVTGVDKDDEVTESSLFPIIATVLAIGLIVGLMAWYLARRKKQYEIDSFEPEGGDEDEFGADHKMDEEDDVDEFVPSFGKRESEEVLVD